MTLNGVTPDLATPDLVMPGRLRRATGAALVHGAMACAVAALAAASQAQTLPKNVTPPLVTRDADKLAFPRNYWDPEYRAKLLVVEFFRSDWEKRLTLDPPPAGQAALDEIAYLHSLVPLRAERFDEIKSQNDANYLPYFFPLMMMHQYSHPRTFELMNVAYALSHVTYPFKHRFNRARPSQLSPTLDPMILTPGHPAYPSGHGFQSWLVALVLAELRPDARPALLALAQRIGMNREVAGVHYPSDTKAGQLLAAQAFAIAAQGPLFQELMADAKAEWR